MLVKEMIEKLKEMPPDAKLKIEVRAYYFQGDDFECVDEPCLNKDGTVTIGEVYANP
jgi:hypothetical protein